MDRRLVRSRGLRGDYRNHLGRGSSEGLKKPDAFTVGGIGGNVVRMPIRSNLSAALILLAAPLCAQQTIPTPTAKVRAALDLLKADNAWTVQQLSLIHISEPTR